MPSTIAPVYSPLGGNTALLAGRVMAFCAEKNKKAMDNNAPVAPPAPLQAALRRMMHLGVMLYTERLTGAFPRFWRTNVLRC